MGVALILIGLIILIIGLICVFADANELAFLLGITGAGIFSSGIMEYQKHCKPTAMDVYQNKTTLEITYKDGVPIDSVVVFKNKEK